ncbi:hypothetical protein [Myxacorys almedinensis]|uniref:Uncharacterized protein n=1 Tax=Myxacorys almedinensis A TaxID=2690445 RepID=A0A8J7Z1F3_9CYAN|nr:hypothetical protein [Myxacorys almedinensis]NDJ18314.1 hypothetical protein [Myxacorys almedinensis A]
MIHGLLWLPLLAVFIGLAWAGWNEYQKLETYRQWADHYDRAKFDIYSVLAQKGDELTWGKATRRGIVQTQTFSLNDVQAIRLLVNRQAVDMQAPPERGKSIELEFEMPQSSVRVPFTQVNLAAKWGEVLLKDWEHLRSVSPKAGGASLLGSDGL